MITATIRGETYSLNEVCPARLEPPAAMYFRKIDEKMTPIGLLLARSAAGIPLKPSVGSVW